MKRVIDYFLNPDTGWNNTKGIILILLAFSFIAFTFQSCNHDDTNKAGFLGDIFGEKSYQYGATITVTVVYCDRKTLVNKWLEFGGKPDVDVRAFYQIETRTIYAVWSDEFAAGHELKHAVGFHHNKVGAWINPPDGSR